MIPIPPPDTAAVIAAAVMIGRTDLPDVAMAAAALALVAVAVRGRRGSRREAPGEAGGDASPARRREVA